MIKSWFLQKASDDFGLKLLKSAANLVCVCQGDRIVYMNPAGAKMIGLDDPSLAIDRAFPDFVDPVYAELMTLGLGTFADEEGSVPLKMIPVKGDPIDVKLFVTELKFGDEPVFMIEALDITEFIKAAEQTKLREQRLTGILYTVAESIIAINEEGRILAFNPAAERLFGYAAHKIIGKKINLLMPEPDASAHDSYIKRYVETGEKRAIGKILELDGRHRDGTIFSMELTISELREGHSRSFIGAMRDVTKRREYEDKIKHLAHHDMLTGLPNRSLCNDRLEETLGRSKRNGYIFALMFIDLDDFKPINDTYGHDAGDYVLKGTAERLNATLRASDAIARVGGDEFVVILDNICDRKAAGRVAGLIVDLLRTPIMFKGQELRIGASIGISVFPEDGEDVAQLTKCADDAMYQAKESGRNCFRFHETTGQK